MAVLLHLDLTIKTKIIRLTTKNWDGFLFFIDSYSFEKKKNFHQHLLQNSKFNIKKDLINIRKLKVSGIQEISKINPLKYIPLKIPATPMQALKTSVGFVKK